MVLDTRDIEDSYTLFIFPVYTHKKSAALLKDLVRKFFKQKIFFFFFRPSKMPSFLQHPAVNDKGLKKIQMSFDNSWEPKNDQMSMLKAKAVHHQPAMALSDIYFCECGCQVRSHSRYFY